MERVKCWWTVRTDCGTRRTLAVSRAKAIRNVKYRLVMDDRGYDRPRPRDFAEMRDIEVVEVWSDTPVKGVSPGCKSGKPHEGIKR